jgi:hypothetical protein
VAPPHLPGPECAATAKEKSEPRQRVLDSFEKRTLVRRLTLLLGLVVGVLSLMFGAIYFEHRSVTLDREMKSRFTRTKRAWPEIQHQPPHLEPLYSLESP